MSGETLRYAVRSETGPTRQGNEDFAAVQTWPHADQGLAPECLLAVIADGMGGHEAGEVASKLAVRMVQETVGRELQTLAASSVDFADLIRRAVEIANQTVWQASQEDARNRNMGTTLTAVLIHDGVAHIAHVGDTRAYVIIAGRLRQLTRDQSVVQDKVDAGLLTSYEARHSTERNQLTQALGVGPHITPEVLTLALTRHFDLVLTTDGVHGTLVKEDFADVVTRHVRPHLMSQDLIERATARDGSDNLTVVWVRGRLRHHLPATCQPRSPIFHSSVRQYHVHYLLAFVLVLAAAVAAGLHDSYQQPVGVTRPPTVVGNEVLYLEARIVERTLSLTCRTDRAAVVEVDGKRLRFKPNDERSRRLRLRKGLALTQGMAVETLALSRSTSGRMTARLKLFAGGLPALPEIRMAGLGALTPIRDHVYTATAKRWPVGGLALGLKGEYDLDMRVSFVEPRPANRSEAVTERAPANGREASEPSAGKPQRRLNRPAAGSTGTVQGSAQPAQPTTPHTGSSPDEKRLPRTSTQPPFQPQKTVLPPPPEVDESSEPTAGDITHGG